MSKNKIYKYKKCAEAESLSHSAKQLAKGLLRLFREKPDIDPLHREMFLHQVLWKITEAETKHKHRTRFCSLAAYGLSGDKLNHDHVYPRTRMVRKLLDCHPDQVDEILDLAVGCTVTRAEHLKLNKYEEFDGWERYRKAEIRIVDVKETQLRGEIQFSPETP